MLAHAITHEPTFKLLAKHRRIDNSGPRPVYKPDQPVIDIHQSKAKFIGLAGSPGVGKTAAGAKDFSDFVKYGVGNAILISPTYTMAKNTAIKELRKWAPPWVKLPYSARPAAVDIGHNRQLYIRSADSPEMIDGIDGVTYVWMDEADLCGEDAFNHASERLSRPFAGTNKRRFLFTLTPQLIRGNSWVRDRIYRPFMDGNPDYYFQRYRFFDCNRYTQADRDRILSEHPQGTWTYARFMAEWVGQSTGAVYPELTPIVDAPIRLDQCEEIVCGVDCGRNDPFVLTVLGRHGSKWYVFAEYWAQTVLQTNPFKIAKGLAELFDELGIKNIIYHDWQAGALDLPVYHDHDPGQIEDVAMELASLGYVLKWKKADKTGPNSVYRQTDYVRKLFIHKLLYCTKNAHRLHDALQTYAWEGVRRAGTSKADGKASHEDSHGPDSLRYGLWSHALETNPRDLISEYGLKYY